MKKAHLPFLDATKPQVNGLLLDRKLAFSAGS
jgi:hypothetical protein